MKTGFPVSVAVLMLICGLTSSDFLFAETQQQSMDSFVGQMLIFRAYDCNEKTKVKWKDIGKQAGHNDMAVSVRRVNQKKDKISFTLEHIGIATIRGGRPNICPVFFDPITLTITEIPASIAEKELLAGVQSLLMTPESYLAFSGYNFPSAVAAGEANPPFPDAPLPTVQLIPPRLLLNPKYPEEMKRSRIGGRVVAAVVIGVDGRVYSPKFIESPGREFEREVLRILPFLRYEPPVKDGKPFAARTMIVWTFNIL